jgi:hypothetical protein
MHGLALLDQFGNNRSDRRVASAEIGVSDVLASIYGLVSALGLGFLISTGAGFNERNAQGEQVRETQN